MRLSGLFLALIVTGICSGADPMVVHPVPSEESDVSMLPLPSAEGSVYTGKSQVELIALTRDKDKYVRQAAAWALADIRSNARSSVPALTELLKDKDQDVRRVAASALGCIWHDAKTAVPALNSMLDDKRTGSVGSSVNLGKYRS